ncbi:MAG TPA: hypothetical protein VGL42_04955 [Opitutaceae bacterium]|jgi:hypothetical protein
MNTLPIKSGVIALAALSIALLAGCATEPAPYVVAGPPVAQTEVVPVSPGPGWFWVGGHYAWRYGRYVWIGGHWARRGHPGAVWIQGHYENRGGTYVWIEGNWH